MMSSCTVEQNGRPRRFGRQLRSGCWTVDWNSIRRRRGSSIARMICGREGTPMRSSIFLGTNSVRGSRSIANGKVFTNFSPAVSTKAAKSMRAIIRNWRLRQCSHQSLEDLSRLYNPILRGWFQYYGRYYRTGLYSVIRQLDQELVNWARQKYKKLRNHVRRARRWVAAVSRRSPHLFAPWATMRGGSLMGAV